MDAIPKTVIFIVGLGAPANLYKDYLEDLKARLPQTQIMVLEWWNQPDYGINKLHSYIGNSEVILIAHSAGGVIALQALEKWPGQVKKIMMLDSHFLHTRKALPTVKSILDIMLSHDSPAIRHNVKNAYAPIIDNDVVFNDAFKFAIDWVNNSFDAARDNLKNLPAHSALHIGFTNSSYQLIDDEDKKAAKELWGKSNVDTKFLPMNHFDLIDDKHAANINQSIITWLHSSC